MDKVTDSNASSQPERHADLPACPAPGLPDPAAGSGPRRDDRDLPRPEGRPPSPVLRPGDGRLARRPRSSGTARTPEGAALDFLAAQDRVRETERAPQ